MSTRRIATRRPDRARRLEPEGGPDPLMRDKHGLIGAQVSRIDGPLKVRGEARFAAEFVMERHGLRRAALQHDRARSHHRARHERRRGAAGVVLVMTHRNAPRMKPPPLFLTAPKAAGGSDLPVMQDDRIHWNGQPVAVVLAETQEQADHAASLIEVALRVLARRGPSRSAREHPRTPDSLVGQPVEVLVGDAEAALAAAPHSVDLTYRTPRHNHNAIEPHAVTLAWDGDELIVHDASQGVKLHAWTLAEVFGLDEDQVHLTSPYVGGGFGGKTLWSHHLLGAAASKLAGRPVRITLSREGVYRLVGGRTNTEQRVAIGADDDGRFTALIHTGISAMTPHNALAEQFTFPARHMYATETLKTDQQVVDMDMLANTFMRAPGESVGTFALESAIDELAIELGLDPIELRIRNEPDKDPSSGLPFSARHLVEAWRAGAERFGWEQPDGAGNAPGRRMADRHGLRHGDVSVLPHAGRRRADQARRDGHATVEMPANEMGMGTATTQTIITAERLGLPLERVTVAYGDSAFPGSMLAGGSQQTASIGGAVIAAQRALVEQLLALAGDDSPLAGLTADEVGGRDEGLCELADPSRWESYSQILARAGRDELSVVASASAPEEMQAYSMHSTGAIFCEVRVNAVTGETRVSPLARLVRLRPHPQSQDRREPVPRRHHHGTRPRAHGGDRVRRAERADHEPEPRRVPRAGAHGRAEDRRHLDRYPGSARPGRRARHRRDRHHRRRPLRSPTRSTTRPASACATCRSRWTSCSEGALSSVIAAKPPDGANLQE